MSGGPSLVKVFRAIWRKGYEGFWKITDALLALLMAVAMFEPTQKYQQCWRKVSANTVRKRTEEPYRA
jgi:hypothetical protein